MPILDLLRHLPEHLQIWATDYGSGLYLILGVIIFAETGLVIAPLLPGDSLLFATGALLALNISGLNLPVMATILIFAALCGDLVNYHVGQWAGPRLFSGARFRWLNRKHLDQTKQFYERHGGKTIILARFLPIVRTYAPFVAGLGTLRLGKFIAFSFVGGSLWILFFLNLGYFFGNIEFVRKNFELTILAIVAVSLAPVAVQFFRFRGSKPA